MTESKTHPEAKIGETVKAKLVTGPDGIGRTVGTAGYVYESAGTYVVDGTEITVK